MPRGAGLAEHTYMPESLREELKNYNPEPMIRVVMMPKDTNMMGFIFGGVIMSHLDVAAGEEARKTAGRPVVTRVIREVEFISRVHVGDWVSYYTKTTRVGNTSVTVKLLVVAHRGDLRDRLYKVTEAECVFVAVDEDGNPARLLHKDAVTID